MKIPFMDLQKQYQSIQKEIENAMEKVLSETAFIGGKYVQEFEEAFAAYCQVKGCVSCGNGTDALFLVLKALGIQPGDEIITVSHTFIASIEACAMVGATPVFVDIDSKTMLIDPIKIEEKVTPKTKAILVVHLYGLPCDMGAILRIKEKYRLFVIEDAAQAHGATWRGKKVGSIGDIGCFSFYPGKNLGAYGDAGAVVSSNEEWLEFIRCYRNHGRKEKYVHFMQGINSRMDGIQAAILEVKLQHLDKWNAVKAELFSVYKKKLEPLGISFPQVATESNPAWHLCVIRHMDRDFLQKHLADQGIQTGIHYPVPCHLQKACLYLGYAVGSLPETEKASQEILSLPLFAEMTKGQIEKVIVEVASFSCNRCAFL